MNVVTITLIVSGIFFSLLATGSVFVHKQHRVLCSNLLKQARHEAKKKLPCFHRDKIIACKYEPSESKSQDLVNILNASSLGRMFSYCTLIVFELNKFYCAPNPIIIKVLLESLRNSLGILLLAFVLVNILRYLFCP